MDVVKMKQYLHEAIEKMNDSQIKKLYQLIRGIFGKAL